MIKITLINHACCLFEFGKDKILCDPWLEGNTFEEGWGLRWESIGAYDFLKKSTHLWVSHFHEDHLNKITLEKILTINPKIIVLANNSHNFKMMNYFKNIGFKKVLALNERAKYRISNALSITRYPATGIDNLLVFN